MPERKFLSERRIFERIQLKLTLKFLEVTSNKGGLASTYDISAKGISIVTNQKILPDVSLGIWIQISNREESLYTRGKVIWSGKFGFSEYRAGVSLEKTELIRMSAILKNIYMNRI